MQGIDRSYKTRAAFVSLGDLRLSLIAFVWFRLEQFW